MALINGLHRWELTVLVDISTLKHWPQCVDIMENRIPTKQDGQLDEDSNLLEFPTGSNRGIRVSGRYVMNARGLERNYRSMSLWCLVPMAA